MNSFQAFLDIVIAIGIVFYAIGQWRNGRAEKKESDSQTAANTIQILSTRADAFERELKEAKAQIHSSEIQIAKLEEANKQKDQLIEQYMKIITNRNPDLEKVLGEVRDFLQALNQKIGDGVKVG